MVVAVLRDGLKAGSTLQRLIRQTRFGDTPIRDFVQAVRQRAVDDRLISGLALSDATADCDRRTASS